MNTAQEVISCSIEKQPQDLWIESGGSATLCCKFDVSAALCLWRYNDIRVNTDSFFPDYQTEKNESGICNLYIRNISLVRDDGNWTCLLPNSLGGKGLLSRTAHLTVLVTPTPPLIHYKGENQVVNVIDGTVARLHCKTKHGYPATNFSWIMEDDLNEKTKTSVEEENNNLKLLTSTSEIMVHVQKLHQGKKLYCIAHHGKRRFSTCVTLNVQYGTSDVFIKPKGVLRVHPGQKVVLHCMADGNPPPTYKWTAKLSGSPSWTKLSTNTNQELIITEHSNGKYRCEAGNPSILHSNASLHSEELTLIVLEIRNTGLSLGISSAVSFGLTVLLSISLVVYLRCRLGVRRKPNVAANEVH